MNDFGGKIEKFKKLSFRENRGTKKEAEARKINKENTITSAINLYNKLYRRYVKDYESSDLDSKEKYHHSKLEKFLENESFQDIDLRWLKKSYDFEELHKDINQMDDKYKTIVNKKPISIKFLKNFINDITNGKVKKNKYPEEYKKRISGSKDILSKCSRKNIDKMNDFIDKLDEPLFG